MEDFEGKEDDVEGEDADAMDMDTDTPTASKNPNSKVPSEVKERVMKVLQQREFDSLRAAKLTQDDFLLLLSYFNEAGFHFA